MNVFVPQVKFGSVIHWHSPDTWTTVVTTYHKLMILEIEDPETTHWELVYFPWTNVEIKLAK
jgi:hypothetical protein